jgi:hypothetical protein
LDPYMETRPGTTRTHHWAVEVPPAAAIVQLLAMAGLDVTQARSSRTPLIRRFPIRTDLQPQQQSDTVMTVPNVMGMLLGSDTTRRFRQSCIAITAHLDQGQADSSSTRDGAVGLAGLLELAQAFSQPAARPRRCLVFIAVSGSDTTASGSRYLIWQSERNGKLRQIKFMLSLSEIRRATSDTVAIDGLSDFDFAVRPDWLVAQHSELGLTVIDGGTISDPQAEHAVFVRKAFPMLSIHPVTTTSALPTGQSAEQLARLFRLIWYVAHDIGARDKLPTWNAEGRRRRRAAGILAP